MENPISEVGPIVNSKKREKKHFEKNKFSEIIKKSNLSCEEFRTGA